MASNNGKQALVEARALYLVRPKTNWTSAELRTVYLAAAYLLQNPKEATGDPVNILILQQGHNLQPASVGIDSEPEDWLPKPPAEKITRLEKACADAEAADLLEKAKRNARYDAILHLERLSATTWFSGGRSGSYSEPEDPSSTPERVAAAREAVRVVTEELEEAEHRRQRAFAMRQRIEQEILDWQRIEYMQHNTKK